MHLLAFILTHNSDKLPDKHSEQEHANGQANHLNMVLPSCPPRYLPPISSPPWSSSRGTSTAITIKAAFEVIVCICDYRVSDGIDLGHRQRCYWSEMRTTEAQSNEKRYGMKEVQHAILHGEVR